MYSTMMLMRVHPGDPRPLHEQVAAALRRAIAEGQCAPGERLPPARDLATAFGVNANTVLRALRDLRDEGLLEFRRGRGIRVVTGPTPQRRVLLERLRELTALAERCGYQRDELIHMIRELP